MACCGGNRKKAQMAVTATPAPTTPVGAKNASGCWDNDGTRPCVRDNFRKMIECRTSSLGWQIYASDTEERRVYYTCKVRSCPSCGYRATLQWQQEPGPQLPD